TEIYTLSLHDALPISLERPDIKRNLGAAIAAAFLDERGMRFALGALAGGVGKPNPHRHRRRARDVFLKVFLQGKVRPRKRGGQNLQTLHAIDAKMPDVAAQPAPGDEIPRTAVVRDAQRLDVALRV